MAFASRLAIIPGGVGGLGCAIGKALHEEGAKLALLYAPFEADKVSQILEQTYGTSSSPDISTYACDITSPASVTAAFDAISSSSSPEAFPSMLINTAGYVNLSPLADTTPEDVLRHYMINLYGPTLTGQAFARLYMRRRAESGSPVGGRIVNIASQAAHRAFDKHGAYCASKAGVVALTKCQANEWGREGITANSVSPGPVWTDLGKKAWADDEVRGEYMKGVPTGRFAEPEEVAHIVTFLCRDESLNINGTDVNLDGGYTAR